MARRCAITFSASILAALLLALGPPPVSARGGAGPCTGVQEGEDREAFLAIYDEAKKAFMRVPGDMGLIPATKNGEQTFCYLPVHTHKRTGGTLHLAVHPDNQLYTAAVIREVAKRFRRPLSSLDI